LSARGRKILAGDFMVKEKKYDYFSIEQVDFAFDLCEEKEIFFKALEKSVPKTVTRFDSKGTYWNLKHDNIVSGFNLCINGGNLYTTDYFGFSLNDFLDFVLQLAYYDDKSLVCCFFDEYQRDSITIIPLEKGLIRVTTYDDTDSNNELNQFIIKSDIIIKKDTFLKQILNLLIKIDKNVKKLDKGHKNRYLETINKTKERLEQYFCNPDEFRQNFNPVTHVRVFDIAYKDLEGTWQFVVSLEDDKRCEPEYWEKQKQEGKILDYDYTEQNPLSIPITEEELRTDMDERVENNWVYSTLTNKWYATNEMMPEPKRIYSLINTRLSYKIEIDDTLYPTYKDGQLESYISDAYDLDGNEYEYEDHGGRLDCWLTIISDGCPVCKIEFNYKQHKIIRAALEKVKNGEYVRFDLDENKQDKMHIWQELYENSESAIARDVAIACYKKSDNYENDSELYYKILNKNKFIDCFTKALDEIEYKINTMKHVLNVGKNLSVKEKFQPCNAPDHNIEYLENFVGNYACAYINSIDGWGILDKNLQWVIEPEYVIIYGKTDPKFGQEIKGFVTKYTYLHNINGKLFIAAKQDKKQFVMDINGDIQIPHVSDKIHYTYLNNELYFIAVDYNKTYIVNSKGEDIVTLDFPVGDKFWLTDEIIIASKDNKFGIVDWKGNILIDFIFSDININLENLDFIAVKYMDMWGFINKSGEIIDFKGEIK